MENVNTNKDIRTDVKPIMDKIKVHGKPIDKSDFWFYVEGDLKTVFHVSEGDGTNLSEEDEAEGFSDYIYYDTYEGAISYRMIDAFMEGDTEALDDLASDGGQVMLYGSYKDLSLKQICYKVLDMTGYSHPENLVVRILSGACADAVFLDKDLPEDSLARQTCIAIWYKTKGDPLKAMEILKKKIPLDPAYIRGVAKAEKREIERLGAKLRVVTDEDFPDELKKLTPISLCYIEKDGMYSSLPIFCGIK